MYYEFELSSIDAWRYDEGWNWNDSFIIEQGIVFHESALTPRKILKYLRKMKILSEESKGKVRVERIGNIFEIQNKNTDEPLFALMQVNSYEEE